jgi:hypothetical protein
MDREDSANRGLVWRRDPRGEVLRPFVACLTGTVLVLRAHFDGHAAALCPAAASVVITADGADIPASAGFDAVVLTELLPQPGAAHGTDRLQATIVWGRARLRPGGRLILSVDNALSLHRLAAGSETPGLEGFPSLEGRPRPDGYQLPTRSGLERSLRAFGLVHQAWWFPFPDRHAPLSLLSERGLARPCGFDPGALALAAASDPTGAGAMLFSPQRAWTPVADQGLIGDLAPAFVVLASETPLPPDETVAIHVGFRRRPEFERLVTFAMTGSGIEVCRTPLNPGLVGRVEEVRNLFPAETYVPGPLWSTLLDRRCAQDGWCPDGVASWAVEWRDTVSRHFAAGAEMAIDTILPASALDAIPKNLVSGDHRAFIDLEWDLGVPLDAGHLALRGLVNALTDVRTWGRSALPPPNLLEALRAVLPRLGLAMDDAQLAARFARESRFQSLVSGHATHRDLSWAAATRLSAGDDPQAGPVPPSRLALLGDPAAEIARLREENEALRAARAVDAAAREAAELESDRRTDRVIAHAAELHRAHDHLQDRLLAREAASWRKFRIPMRLRRLLKGTT